MKKTYCDGCEKEISRNFVSEGYKPVLVLNGNEFQLEIMVTMNKQINAGDLCLECLLKIINVGR